MWLLQPLSLAWRREPLTSVQGRLYYPRLHPGWEGRGVKQWAHHGSGLQLRGLQGHMGADPELQR